MAVKTKEVKSKGEKERYTHLNAEFQKIARRDKKAFLSDQCKEIEGNNRMGKTMDLTEAEDIKKSYIKNTQKNCTSKTFTIQIITMVRSLT